MNDAIVGTGKIVFGRLGGAHATLGDPGVNFLLALAGNLVGGTMFVTLTHLLQAHAES